MNIKELLLPENRPQLMKAVLHIYDKNGDLVPLDMNRSQLMVWPHLTHRDLIVKYRQGGFSTMTLGRYFLDTITHTGINMAVISHEERATQRLLQKVHTFFDNLPEWFKPAPDHKSVHELNFPALGSTIYIGTAGQRLFGRGDTFHRILISELAFWGDEQIERILPGLEESCPLDGCITIESTPNGEGNLFHRLALASSKGLSSYRLHFLPWFIHDEYFILPGDDAALPGDSGDLGYSSDEMELVEKFALDQDQIRWRRRKLSDRGELFPQEYPEDFETCSYRAAG